MSEGRFKAQFGKFGVSFVCEECQERLQGSEDHLYLTHPSNYRGFWGGRSGDRIDCASAGKQFKNPFRNVVLAEV